MTKSLRDTAQALLANWDTPEWNKLSKRAELMAELRAALVAPTPALSSGGSEPVVWVSSKQLPHNPDHAYIACRLHPEGNFDTPLYATPSSIVSGWQDISTAPRDGEELLVWNGKRRHVAHFDKIEGEWVSSYKTTTKRLIVTPLPTQWSLLPTEPATEGE